ncbi:MAG: helicase-exonuclease AddAB subunit AddA [Oscillospiraceae bacterium]|nr:helicase-exonuclease AddAB subunit AddA [Candidatus Limimonas egerieequi]
MWTKDQQNAIDARQGTVIVSAAAGSGKTAVLIERIIQTITDTKNPCDVDKLLIVTFTRAATAEIRARLFTAVNDALKKLIESKDSEDNFESKFKHLKRQQMLIPSANIYTIDAFCSNLVRENFETLQIPPDFSMIDEVEAEKLKSDVLTELLEKYYSSKNKEFENLVELFMSGKNDRAIEDVINNVYDFSRAFANPKKILQKSLEEFNENFSYKTSKYIEVIRDTALFELEYYIKKIENQLDLCQIVDPTYSTHKNFLYVSDDLNCARKIHDLIVDYQIDDANTLSINKVFERWSSATKGFNIVENKSTFDDLKDFRNELKDVIKALPLVFCETEQEVIDDIKTIKPSLELLIKIVFELDDTFRNKKLEQHTLDFSDVEAYALQLLLGENGEKTELAKDLSTRFEGILIDEYQDTNDLQDTIFRCLSNEENNLFLVGDVKQSIYGFRNAMPAIFNSKRLSYNPYNKENPEYPATITLGYNFRSREGILEFVNYLFKQIMSPTIGDVEYNENEELHYYDGKDGQYYNKPLNEPETELHLFNIDKDVDNINEEAKFVANYIINKVEKEKVAKYSDFAILMQKTTSVAPQVERILKEAGIPVYSETSSSFLDTSDVMTITSFIKTINNPTLDIPLIATLMSPIYGFSADDMADLAQTKQNNYYARLCEGRETNEKYEKVISDIEKYRKLSISLPAGELVRKIYEDTSFPQIAGAMTNGAQRIANLMLFQEYADAFDQTSSFGISAFVRYIESIEENDGSLNTASLSSNTDNVVKIMSIHKSKGLEFKYCFILNTKHKFNEMDLYKSLLFDSDLGLGIKGRNPKTGSTYKTITYVATQMAKRQKLYSEFERVLYVALTRAKEKLIIVGSIHNENYKKDGSLSSIYMDKFATMDKCENFEYLETIKHSTFLDWILMCMIRHPDAQALRDLSQKPCYVLPDAKFRLHCEVHGKNEDAQEITIPERPTTIDESLKQDLEARINFEYKYLPLSKVSTKRAASKLQEEGFNEQFFATSKPNFLNDQNFTPAQRGTCLHKFMQHADFNIAKDDVEKEIEALKAKKYLTDEEAEVLNIEKIKGFFRSDISKRIFDSNNVYREKKFSVLVPAIKYDTSLGDEFKDEKILIQGIADCVFEEDGKLIIVDYKTDRTTNEEELIERHKPQLSTYKDALEQVLGKEVVACYIYAFSLDKEIKVI